MIVRCREPIRRGGAVDLEDMTLAYLTRAGRRSRHPLTEAHR